MMKAIVTAEINREYMMPLERLLEIEYAGWGTEQRICSEEEMVRLTAGKDILITSYDPITKRVMDASPGLRLIVCTRANPVNVDTAYAKERNILISYAPSRNTVCAAEFTVALMLCVTRKIPMSYMALKSGNHLAERREEKTLASGLRDDVTWALGGDTPYVLYKGFQLSGHSLGVIGYGTIGREVARICRAFGMKILVADPFLNQAALESGDEKVELDELLSRADIVTLHCKDTPETRGIMNAAAFDKMKPSAYFINTSRGALVDEKALIGALRSRKIAGAALDVFASEPIAKDHPFITELDNIVVTPHIAGATYDAIDNHTRQLVSDVGHFLRGEPLEFEYR